MSLSNLYFRGCFEQPSQEQIDAVEGIPGGGVEGSVVDRSCAREDLNTCGQSIQELLFDKEEVFLIDPRTSPRGDLDLENDYIIIPNHGLREGEIAYYSTEKQAIAGLSSSQKYFVKPISKDEIQLFTSRDLSEETRVDLISGSFEENYLISFNPNADSLVIGGNLDFVSGDSVYYQHESSGNIAGLQDNQLYYIKVIDQNVISLHFSRDLSDSSRVDLKFNDSNNNEDIILSGTHSLVKIYRHFLTIPPIEIYSTQKGLYKTWGEIEFPWEISSLTPDLFFELTDDKWAISTYRRITAYAEGVRVLLIEDDGYELGLYEANQDVLSISGPFDYSKWDKICGVKTTTPVGLPTSEELRERYTEYALEYFYDEWDEVDSTWSEGTYELALQNCQSQGGTLEDFEKCMRDSSSDVWKDARVRREFFYKRGDIVRVEAECGDTVCIWIAIQDMPATEAVYAEYVDFKPGPYWQKIYCVNTKANRCLEYQRKKEPALGYDVVQIGSLGHYVEVPVPYRLKPTAPSLDERAEIRQPPAVLTQEQIDALTQPTEE